MAMQLSSMFPLVVPIDTSYREYRGYIPYQRHDARAAKTEPSGRYEQPLWGARDDVGVYVHASLVLLEECRHEQEAEEYKESSSRVFVWEIRVGRSGDGVGMIDRCTQNQWPKIATLVTRSASFSIREDNTTWRRECNQDEEKDASLPTTAEMKLCEALRQLKSAAERGDVEIGKAGLRNKKIMTPVTNTSPSLDTIDTDSIQKRIRELDLIGWENVENVSDLNFITFFTRYALDAYLFYNLTRDFIQRS